MMPDGGARIPDPRDAKGCAIGLGCLVIFMLVELVLVTAAALSILHII